MASSLSMSQAVHCEQRHSLRQRVEISQKLLRLRSDLIVAVRGEKFDPRAICPGQGCGYVLTELEILKGFSNDPHDIQTTCPQCGMRFEARIITSRGYTQLEYMFYCPSQTLANIQNHEEKTPEMLQRFNASLYHSAIYHFGTITRTFARIDVEYPHANLEVFDWRKKVIPFLGRLPDTVIAEIVNVSVNTVRYLRIQKKIPRFYGNDLLSD